MANIPTDQLPRPIVAGSSLAWAPAPALEPPAGGAPHTDPWPRTPAGPPPAGPPPVGPSPRQPGRRGRAIAIVSAVALVAAGAGALLVSRDGDGGRASSIADERDDDRDDERDDDRDDDHDDERGDERGDVNEEDGDLPPDGLPDAPPDTPPGTPDPVPAGMSEAELADAYVALLGVPAAPATLGCIGARVVPGDESERLVRGDLLTLPEAQLGFEPFVACAPDADFLVLMVPAVAGVFGGAVDETCVADHLVTFGVAGRAEARALAWVDAQQFVDRAYTTFLPCAT